MKIFLAIFVLVATISAKTNFELLNEIYQVNPDNFFPGAQESKENLLTTVCNIDKAKVLRDLRERLQQQKFDGYYLTTSDAHQNEYISKSDKYIEFLSGFSGESGHILITQTEAFLWTDSRFYIQAAAELYPDWKMKKMETDQVWYEYFATKLGTGKILAFEPFQIPIKTFETLQAYFKEKKMEIKPTTVDLVNQLWIDRPVLTANPIFIHKQEFAGRTTKDKISDLYLKVKALSADIEYFFTMDLSEIAWLLNLRGNDIEYNPQFYSYILIKFTDQATYQAKLFVRNQQLSEEIKTYLTTNKITAFDYADVYTHLQKIDKPILFEKARCNCKLFNSLPDFNLIRDFTSPIIKLKTLKNQVELTNSYDTHIRDAAAIVSYLSWLNQQLNVQKIETLTEYNGAEELEKFRAKDPKKQFIEPSFGTISSIGKNSQIVHYVPKPQGSALLNNKEIYLLDSGGQYYGGTTDVTRTMHYGVPTENEKKIYTAVLLGHIHFQRLIFPSNKKYSPSHLDSFARLDLWKLGLDFGHGTGHGVGYLSNVHEKPYSVSKSGVEPWEENAIVTDEPGHYETDNFGVRIENDLIVKKSALPNFFEFEILTYVPYEKKLINKNMLTQDEINYIDSYHKKVQEKVQPILQQLGDATAEAWLLDATSQL